MYMHVWYWDNNLNYAATHYYHSEFIGKASAKDVFESCGAYAYQLLVTASCCRFLLMTEM